MTGPHFAISASTKFLWSTGLRRLSLTTTAPMASWRLVNSGSFSAWRSAAQEAQLPRQHGQNGEDGEERDPSQSRGMLAGHGSPRPIVDNPRA